MHIDSIDDFYELLQVQASTYWDTHFSFTTSQKKRVKKLSKAFVDLLLINTVIPLKFAYHQYLGKDIHENILDLISQIKPEKNTIIQKFNTLKPKATHAMHTQALIQLKSEYRDKNACLQCGVGNWVLGK